jgi:hypothetical protein
MSPPPDTVVGIAYTKDALRVPDFLILQALAATPLAPCAELPVWLRNNWGQLPESLRDDVVRRVDALFAIDDRFRRQERPARALGPDLHRVQWEALRKLWRQPK